MFTSVAFIQDMVNTLVDELLADAQKIIIIKLELLIQDISVHHIMYNKSTQDKQSSSI